MWISVIEKAIVIWPRDEHTVTDLRLSRLMSDDDELARARVFRMLAKIFLDWSLAPEVHNFKCPHIELRNFAASGLA